MNSTNFKWNILAVLAITLALFVVFGQSTSITNVIKAADQTGTMPSPPTTAGKLAWCKVSPGTASLSDLGTQVLTYTAYDKDNTVVSGVVVSWSMSGIAGVLSTSSSTTNSSGQATTTFTGTKPGGAVTVTGKGEDTSTNQTCSPTGSVMTVTIAAATATPSALAAAATPTPEAVPATSPAVPAGGAQSWATPQEGITIETPDKTASITIPVGALAKGTFISITPKDITTPSGLESARGTAISYSDSAGTALTTVELSKPATLTLTLTQADIDRVLQGAMVVVLRYDSANEAWIELSSTVNLAGKTASALVTKLSDFAVGIKLQAGTATATPVATAIPPATATPAPTATPIPTATAVPPTATAVPPDTGDFTPSSGLLIMLVLVGLMLVVGSGYYLRYSKS